ncbi:ATP-NAD kinase family protein [Kitasatospora purpeofusca]|uniref:ATP-NAD kinase family protein n=1 Tax=Kitasatospora purpeofusca TaxID=67352 RepID=UPI00224E0138|nr:NAD(+)/NADH kinase [Kitasatospora purpeofusca]MCX4758967.1 NAD(+)/NADH kinase [Kitasatospora purpeofusca]WSR30613.1 NAD(+)/NADH kinase [Kitasatospora purpeofusca]
MIVGLIVNPVAGLGGAVALKGSDGPDVQARALALGAVPRAAERAAAALRALRARRPDVLVRTVAGPMGEDSARAAGVPYRIAHRPPATSVSTGAAGTGAVSTGAADTRAAVAALGDVDLLLFAGGDGTARDVLDAAPRPPVLGVPAGVKVYSGCFAVSPAAAGATAAGFAGSDGRTVDAEVVDLDEEGHRAGLVGARLYGTVRVPAARDRLSGRKTGSSAAPPGSAESIARAVVAGMRPGTAYALGPGATTLAVGRALGLALTPLGVDVVRDGALLAPDVTEQRLHAIAMSQVTHGVLSVIGGQGFVIGRGNQQFSPRVLAALAGVVVLATQQKLAALGGRPLLVDSGDPRADAAFGGHVRVVTGHRESVLYRISSASEELS